MNRRLVVAVTLAVVCAAGVMSQSCEPDCSGKEPFDKVPDPKNCSQYYLCVGDGLPADSPVPCPEGNIFDTGIMDCAGSGTCDDSCAGNACHLHCNGSMDIIADPNDCSTFYICGPGGVVSPPYQCPDDRPVFDGTDCVTDRNKCCDSNDLCTPVCEPGVVQAPDPVDCHKYYICVDGVINPDYHFECGSGEFFDTAAGHCVPETEPCTNLCDSGGNTPGGGGSTPAGGSTTTGGGSTTVSGGKTTTVAVETTTGDCVMSFTCPAEGFYSMCHTCQPYYYHCTGSGSPGVLSQCSGNLVFNPDPDYPFCILPGNCPYHP